VTTATATVRAPADLHMRPGLSVPTFVVSMTLTASEWVWRSASSGTVEYLAGGLCADIANMAPPRRTDPAPSMI
jgi:hypothetical protein